MAVDTPQLKIDPYQSTVPVPQLPPSEISAETRPSAPLQGQFGGHKGSGALAIGDAIVKGLMLGHAEKEKKKLTQAQATIAAADASTEAAYSKYQDTLSKSGGKVDDPEAKAAYDAYMGVFNASKQAKAQFVMPEKPQKGQQKPAGGGKDGKKQVPGMGGIKEFFEANPHIIPSIALMTMQPKPQGLSKEAQVQNLQMQGLQQEVESGKQNLEIGKQNLQRGKEQDQLQAQERQVHEKGGIETVLADKSAPPELQQAARRMKYEALDKETPEGKIKTQLMQKVLNGESMTPQEKMMAGSFGLIPQPQPQVITGKNGHQQQILVDPTTNQPVTGTKPLDLGPSQQMQAYYAQRSADHAEIAKAVKENPGEYGITSTGDPKADKAAVDARVDQLMIRHDFGISTLSDQYGRTGFETQQQNQVMQNLVKDLKLNTAKSVLNDNPGELTYPDGKKTTVGTEYFKSILDQFVDNSGDIYAFRPAGKINNPDGKSPEVLDTERKFFYQYVKNKLLTEKGKAAMTPEQADLFLKETSLGKPITAKSGIGPPPKAPAQSTGGIQPPPQTRGRGFSMAGGIIPSFGAPPQVGAQGGQSDQSSVKLYMVPGYESPVQLSPEETAKAKAANIPIEELSPELMNQFLQ